MLSFYFSDILGQINEAKNHCYSKHNFELLGTKESIHLPLKLLMPFPLNGNGVLWLMRSFTVSF